MTLAPLLCAIGLALGNPPADVPAVPAPEPGAKWAEAVALHWLASAGGTKARQPESVRMLDAIMNGRMGGGDGWFHPSQSRLGWKWLAPARDGDRDGRVTMAEFRGPAAFFDRLDRDHDGVLTAADFDWSDGAPLAKQDAVVGAWFNRTDADSNGRLSKEEWARLFEKASAGKDHLTPDDLRRLVFPPPPSKAVAQAMQKKFMPSREILLAGLFANELGSPYEGPRVGQAAPRFTLPTHDGAARVSLGDCLGEKPVVLIFGSFT